MLDPNQSRESKRVIEAIEVKGLAAVVLEGPIKDEYDSDDYNKDGELESNISVVLAIDGNHHPQLWVYGDHVDRSQTNPEACSQHLAGRPNPVR